MSESEIIKKINDILLKLKSSGSIIVNKNLARNIGLDAAILYSELCSKYKYFEKNKKLGEDGYFFNTVENMKNDAFLSDYRQREAIKILKELGLIYYQRRCIPGRGMSTLRYFKVNMDYERIARLTKNLSNQNLKNRASKFKDTNLKKLDSNNTNVINTNILNGIVMQGNNTSNLNQYKESIDYYLRKYQEYMNRPHPILKKEKWLKVIRKMQDFGEESGIDAPQDFNRLIDSYFKADFKNYPCDRNILHFASDNIMLNRFYEELYRYKKIIVK